MKIITEPLNIGAEDLLRGVEYTYCGDLYVFTVKFPRKKWKQRYIVISQGCVYIYTDMNGKKPEQAWSLKDVDGAQECEPECGHKICFCLRYKKHRHLSLFLVIQLIQENDSWIGSAETVPRLKFEKSGIRDYGGYNEVDESQFRQAKSLPVQPVDELLRALCAAYLLDFDIHLFGNYKEESLEGEIRN